MVCGILWKHLGEPPTLLGAQERLPRQRHHIGLLRDKWSSYRQVHREEEASRRTGGSWQREQNERERSDPSETGKASGGVHVGWAWMMATMGRILVPGKDPRAQPMEEGKHEVRPGCARSPAWQFLLGLWHDQGTGEWGLDPEH